LGLGVACGVVRVDASDVRAGGSLSNMDIRPPQESESEGETSCRGRERGGEAEREREQQNVRWCAGQRESERARWGARERPRGRAEGESKTKTWRARWRARAREGRVPEKRLNVTVNVRPHLVQGGLHQRHRHGRLLKALRRRPIGGTAADSSGGHRPFDGGQGLAWGGCCPGPYTTGGTPPMTGAGAGNTVSALPFSPFLTRFWAGP